VKTTEYFDTIRRRADRRVIKDEWIERAISEPIREEKQSDGRTRRWAPIAEMNNRVLRVILLPDGTVHNAFFDRRPMKIRYFPDTDTLLLELRDVAIAETRDLDDNTIVDLDESGDICAITIEHASTRADAPNFSYEQVTA